MQTKYYFVANSMDELLLLTKECGNCYFDAIEDEMNYFQVCRHLTYHLMS